jgi:hypothetical protein
MADRERITIQRVPAWKISAGVETGATTSSKDGDKRPKNAARRRKSNSIL